MAAAATAAAAVVSSFTTSMHSFKCVSLKAFPSDHLTRVPCSRSTAFDHVSRYLRTELSAIGGFSRISRNSRTSSAFAQEEMALAISDETAGEAPDDEAAVELGGENTKLYFGNLPYSCDSSQLAGIVQEYASPELIEVLYDKNSGRSRGFAFVTMSSVEECNIVIQNLDKTEYGGRIIRVNFADQPKPKEPLYPETDYKLFVGNLSWSVSSESLKEAFENFGNVVGARVLYDGETGRSRGYGFVSYETKEEMEAALKALDGVELEGRNMRVSLAEGKKQ